VRTKVALLGFAVAIVAVGSVATGTVQAQTAQPLVAAAPTPSPSPSPGVTPTPKKASRLHLALESYTSGTNQQFVGPGVDGAAEIPNFSGGGPLAPAVPYDFFSGAPTVTGEAISQDLLITPTYRLLSNLDVSATFGYGSIGGSGNVGSYWGGSLMPTINPHLGSLAYTLTPSFPTHNGQDSVNATKVSVLSGSITLHDGKGQFNAGWFDLKQSVPFVFSQAPWTNTPFQLAPQIPQSIGDGTPAVDVFKNDADVLPLQGYDAWGKSNGFMVEFSDANLPAPAGNSARETSLSGVYQAGDVQFSAEAAHLTESGPVSARVLFGGASSVSYDGAIAVPYSTVLAQRMAVEGLGASLPVATGDVAVRYGHSCYAADSVAIPTGGCTSGNFYYAKLHQGFSKFDLAVELVRYEPTYAPALLSYGTIENVWTAPFAFPGTWLNGDYSFVDTNGFGANLQGVRASTTFLIFGVETRLAFGRYAQVSPFDLSDGLQPGFVEPYFSPQLTNSAGVRGTETHAEGWFTYHSHLADITLDLSDVATHRAAAAGRPEDAIAMDYPSAVLSFTHTFNRVLAGFGAGRYAVQGSFDTIGVINASLSQDVEFFGLQYRANANTAYGLEYQLFSVDGTPVIPNGLSPAYHGPQLQFYQRLKT
jgi:hypothetical protein